MLRRNVRAPAPPPVDQGAEPGRKRRRRRGGPTVTALLLLFALFFLAIAVLRVIGIDGNSAIVPAMALTPYVAPAGLLLALLAFGLRRRIMAAAVFLLALSMVVLLLPRIVSNNQPAATGEHLRVLAANLHAGGADPAALVKLVRDNNVDVLTLPELTRVELPVLDQAGLGELLPYRVVDPGAGADGSGILSRYPLRQTVLVEAVVFSEPSAVVNLPGRDDIEILAAHVQSAAHGDAEVWRRELSRLPPTAPDRIRVLAGDFNSTLDHAAFRAVLDRGFVDAAEQTGKGLVPTWSSLPFGAPVTIDHVLADHRCAVRNFAVLHLPGSDHNAVFADLQLPN